MDNYARGQASGNAAKIAADLAVAAGVYQLDPAQLFENFRALYPAVLAEAIANNESVELADPVPDFLQKPQPAYDAQAAVMQAFPGTTVANAPQAQPAVVAPPSNVVQFTPAPAPIPNQGSPAAGDPATAEAWNVFFNDIAANTWMDNWFDNRTTKRGNQPDFRHKTWKRSPSDKYTVGLYMDGKKNPADLAERLAAVGIH